MTNYVDLDKLRIRVYFQSATLDDRFKWEEVTPDNAPSSWLLFDDPGVTAGPPDGTGPMIWADGFRRYRLVDCAHQEIYRDGALCCFCGHANPYEPPAEEAARKARAKGSK